MLSKNYFMVREKEASTTNLWTLATHTGVRPCHVDIDP